MLLTTLILISISLLFGPLSNVMLWKKYTNFADGLSHSSIMSAIIASFFGFDPLISSIINTIIFFVLVYLLKSKNDNNLIITIVSISLMSVGLIFQEYFGIDTNINNILFGDMELANYYDLLFIIILTIITYIVLFYNFNSIILISLNKDLAVARGVRVKLIEIVILCIMSITIGICFKLIGSFMLFGILIIPPTIARLFSGSPQEMIIKTIIISITTSIISAILAEMTHINISQLLICLNFVIFIFSKIILQIYKK